MVRAKLGPVTVGAGADGTFQRVERFLRFFAAHAAQPVFGGQFVRRTVTQHKAVGHNHKAASGAGMAHPAKIDVIFQLGVDKLAVGPVAHRVEGATPFDERFDRLIPRQRGVVVVDVIEHAAVHVHRFFDFRAVERNGAVPQAAVLFRADDAQQRVFKEFGVGPDTGVAHAQRGHAGRFQRFGGGKELIHAQRITDGDAVVIEQFFVVPQTVAAMHAHRHLVHLAVFAHYVGQSCGHYIKPALFFVNIGDGRDKFRLNILAQQLKARVNLPGVGRVAAGQPGLQYRPGRRAAAAGDGSVDNFDIGIGGAVGCKQRVERGGFTAGCPPRENLQFAFGRRGLGLGFGRGLLGFGLRGGLFLLGGGCLRRGRGRAAAGG